MNLAIAKLFLEAPLRKCYPRSKYRSMMIAHYTINDKVPGCNQFTTIQLSHGVGFYLRRGLLIMTGFRFTHTEKKITCEMEIYRSPQYSIGKFVSTGGLDNSIHLSCHGCVIAPWLYHNDGSFVMFDNIPPGTVVDVIGYYSDEFRGMMGSRMVFRGGYSWGSLFKHLSYPGTKWIGEFRAVVDEYIDYLQTTKPTHDAALEIWRTQRPWNEQKLVEFIAKWAQIENKHPLVLFLRHVSRNLVSTLPICPFLLESCQISTQCTTCPEQIRVLQDMFNVDCDSAEWAQLYWPFFGGVRDCDTTEACCEWIDVAETVYPENYYF